MCRRGVGIFWLSSLSHWKETLPILLRVLLAVDGLLRLPANAGAVEARETAAMSLRYVDTVAAAPSAAAVARRETKHVGQALSRHPLSSAAAARRGNRHRALLWWHALGDSIALGLGECGEKW